MKIGKILEEFDVLISNSYGTGWHLIRCGRSASPLDHFLKIFI